MFLSYVDYKLQNKQTSINIQRATWWGPVGWRRRRTEGDDV
jgi:hypothetical protein